MQTRPENWAALIESGKYRVEYKLQIAGIDYDATHLHGVPTIEWGLLNKPQIGRVCSAVMTAEVIPIDGVTIPRSAPCWAYCRLTSIDKQTVTDWIPKGRYYVKSRSSASTIVLTMQDEMLKSGRTYLDKTSLEWPAAQKDIVADIARIMDVEVDERTVINEGEAYTVESIDGDALMSEVLSWIAICNGGNWVMSDSGKLRLIPLASPAPEAEMAQSLGRAYKTLADIGSARTISRIILTDDAEESFAEGDDSGMTLTAECPFANQGVVKDLCNTVDGTMYGAIYQPFEASTAYIDPALELGDTVGLKTRLGEKIRAVLYYIKANCTVSYPCDISAGIDDETDDEYPYEIVTAGSDDKAVKTNRKYYGNSINKRYGFRSEMDGGGYAQFNADGMEFTDETGKKCLYYDKERKTFVMDGTLGANAIVSSSLYAENGIVSELTVDRLVTARHIQKYLLHDTSDDSYIRIEGEVMQFISATPAGMYNRLLTEDGVILMTEDYKFIDCEANGTASYTQAVNRRGELLYWQKDIAGAEISAEGYPLINGVQVFTTTENTGFPCHIYVYDETVMAEYKFGMSGDGEIPYNPMQTWGRGTGYGDNGKGRIEKITDSFKMGYTTRKGEELAVTLSDDGFIDLQKTRKPLRFDFSHINADKTFEETIDGNDTQQYKVTFDSAGRIASIQDENGHITEVVWE